jgi:hypothetical protein
MQEEECLPAPSGKEYRRKERRIPRKTPGNVQVQKRKYKQESTNKKCLEGSPETIPGTLISR